MTSKQARKAEIIARLERLGRGTPPEATPIAASRPALTGKAARKQAIIERLQRLDGAAAAEGGGPGVLEHMESVASREIPKRIRKQKILHRLNRLMETPVAGGTDLGSSTTLPRVDPRPPSAARHAGSAPRYAASRARGASSGPVQAPLSSSPETQERRRKRRQRKQEMINRLNQIISDERRSPESEDSSKPGADGDSESELVATAPRLKRKQMIVARLKLEWENDHSELSLLAGQTWQEVKDVIPEKRNKAERKRALIEKLQQEVKQEEENIQQRAIAVQQQQEAEIRRVFSTMVVVDEKLPKWKRKQLMLEKLKKEYEDSSKEVEELQAHASETDEAFGGMLSKQQRKKVLIDKMQRELQEHEAAVESWAREVAERKRIRRERRRQEEENIATCADSMPQYLAQLPVQLPKWQRKQMILEKLKQELQNDDYVIQDLQQKTWAEVNEVMPTLTAKQARKRQIIADLQHQFQAREQEFKRRASVYNDSHQAAIAQLGTDLNTFLHTISPHLPAVQRKQMYIDRLKQTLADTLLQPMEDPEDTDDDSDDSLGNPDSFVRPRKPTEPVGNAPELDDSSLMRSWDTFDTPGVWRRNPRRLPLAPDEGAAELLEWDPRDQRRRPVPPDEGAAEEQLYSPHRPRREPQEPDFGAAMMVEEEEPYARRRPMVPDTVAAEEREPHIARRQPTQPDEGAATLPEYDNPWSRRYPVAPDEGAAELREREPPNARRTAPEMSYPAAQMQEETVNPYARRYPVASSGSRPDELSEPDARRQPVTADGGAPQELLSKRDRKAQLVQRLNHQKSAFVQNVMQEIKRQEETLYSQDVEDEGDDPVASHEMSEFLAQQWSLQKTLRDKKEQKAAAKAKKWLNDPDYQGWLKWCENFMLSGVDPEGTLGLEAYRQWQKKENEDYARQMRAQEAREKAAAARAAAAPPAREFKVISVKDTEVGAELDRLAAEVDRLEKEEAEEYQMTMEELIGGAGRGGGEELDPQQEEELARIEGELAEMEAAQERERARKASPGGSRGGSRKRGDRDLTSAQKRRDKAAKKAEREQQRRLEREQENRLKQELANARPAPMRPMSPPPLRGGLPAIATVKPRPPDEPFGTRARDTPELFKANFWAGSPAATPQL